MKTYRITIEELELGVEPVSKVVITCTSAYTLDNDITEWVKEEIDSAATIEKGTDNG